MRFISELTKFKLCPFAKIFNVLSACVRDFKPHSLEQLAQILECCGRFLYLTPQTHPHLVKLLDIVSGTTSVGVVGVVGVCLLYTSPSPRDATLSRMPSSA